MRNEDIIGLVRHQAQVQGGLAVILGVMPLLKEGAALSADVIRGVGSLGWKAALLAPVAAGAGLGYAASSMTSPGQANLDLEQKGIVNAKIAAMVGEHARRRAAGDKRLKEQFGK